MLYHTHIISLHGMRCGAGLGKDCYCNCTQMCQCRSTITVQVLAAFPVALPPEAQQVAKRTAGGTSLWDPETGFKRRFG